MKLSICCLFMLFKSRENAQVEVSENVQNNNNNARNVIVVAKLMLYLNIVLWCSSLLIQMFSVCTQQIDFTY
jgi:hypothetical protein